MSLVSVLVSLLLVTIVQESVAVRKDRKLEVIPQKCNTVENLSGYCGQPFDCEDALDEWEAQDVEPNFCHYVNDNDFTICCPRKSEFRKTVNFSHNVIIKQSTDRNYNYINCRL